LDNIPVKNLSAEAKQNKVFILNTHIPYVLKEGEVFQEQENWIFESITETYIPVLEVLSEIKDCNTNGNEIILSFTPCTLKQMVEGKERYLKYLEILKNVALAEIDRTQSLESFNKVEKNRQNFSEEEMKNLNKTAGFYLERIEKCISFYENNDVLKFINNLKNIQLWTSTPNHNFLPIYKKTTAEYFIKRGIEEFEKNFNRKPDGFWLPECAFSPGIEKILTGNNIKATALNINSIAFFTGKEKSGIYSHNGLRLYIHDFRICKYLWKAPEKTIPAHPVYREFYRDLGFDVSHDYLKSLGVPIPEKRKNSGVWTGFKYHAVSESETRLGDKYIYNIDEAKKQVKNDTQNFYNILEENKHYTNDNQTFVLAFDSEFFGHWWMEGPWWLKEVFTNAN
jgi:1,4-alpha-glucan branching enzyme